MIYIITMSKGELFEIEAKDVTKTKYFHNLIQSSQ